MTDNEEKYEEWEEKLWRLYESLFKDAKYTIKDVVIFPNNYATARFKVMVMNREPYDDEEKSYSLNRAIAEQIYGRKMPFTSQRILRSHLCQYLSVIHLLVEKNFSGVSEEEVIDFVNNSSNEDFVNYLSDSAYVNVKKSDGVGRSKRANLKKYAEKGIEVLKEQIRFCNPSIILAGDVCDDVIEDLFDWGKTTLYDDEGNSSLKIYELLVDGKPYPFIDMYHPSRNQNYVRNGEEKSMKMYYLELFKGIMAVEKQYPGYWNKRMDNKCFQN